MSASAATNETPKPVCGAPDILDVVEPDPSPADVYAAGLERFRRPHLPLKDEFTNTPNPQDVP